MLLKTVLKVDGMKRLLKACAMAGTIGALPFSASAATPLKFVMDWAYEGPQAMWTVAEQSGCYGQRNLDVKTDRGFGSGDSISKVAAGAYDIGIADFGSVVAYNAQYPDKPLLITFIISDAASNSISVLKKTGITKPKDLEGRRIADPHGEASRVMFPAFAKANGIDMNKINWVTVSPNLRQASLLRGQADAAGGHVLSVVNGLRVLGIKKEDIFTMRFADYGVQVPGTTVIVRPEWVRNNGDTMKSFLGCLVSAINKTAANPEAAVATLKPHNPLLDPKLELDHLNFTLNNAIFTPYVQQHGFSEVDPARLDASLQQVADAIGKPKVALDSIWSGAYLPPATQRVVKR